MAENTNIEWCDHTFNPVRGCTKVSDGCKHCYAETLSQRNPAVLGEWGPKGKRVVASENYWKQPIKWNKQAEQAGQIHTVFCASLADVGEDRPEWIEPRKRLIQLIHDTPHLLWLLLTKRPENIVRLFGGHAAVFAMKNVMWGGSIEDQPNAEARIPELLRIPGRHFLSCEPLLGPLDLESVQGKDGLEYDVLGGARVRQGQNIDLWGEACSSIDWVITGGESGPHARPMHPDWIRSLRDQCEAMEIPFLFKQWGRWVPNDDNCWLQTHYPEWDECRTLYSDGRTEKGGRGTRLNDGVDIYPAGKKRAGNHLDGKQYLEFPKS